MNESSGHAGSCESTALPASELGLSDIWQLLLWFAVGEPVDAVRRARGRRVRATIRRLFRRCMFVALASAFVLGLAGRGWLRLALALALTGGVFWCIAVASRARARRPHVLTASAFSHLRSRARGRPSTLPQRTLHWLEQERGHLPASARGVLDDLGRGLEALACQTRAIEGAPEVRDGLQRLLTAELPELVTSYRRLPLTAAQPVQPGTASPEQQLLAGLTIIATQLAHLLGRLTERELTALATQVHYLHLKYGADGESSSI
jgi:hypothetical protein